MKNWIIKNIKQVYYNYLFSSGYEKFKKTGISTQKAYLAMRNLFVLTQGKSNDSLHNKIISERGKYNLNYGKGVLGNLDQLSIAPMIRQMNENGYYIFENVLDEDIINNVVKFAECVPADYTDFTEANKPKISGMFEPQNPKSPRYDFAASTIVVSDDLKSLIFDQSLLFFAQEYLQTKPILDLVALWWSVPFKGVGKNEAAQMYHFDLDRIKFMKFFFYLTEVDTNNGPHCYVKTSHKLLPKELSRDGRFSDQEIEKVYGSDKMIEICGKKGSIIAVDTRGMHKGKELFDKKRLLFQIEFANSMFGQIYPPVNISLNEDQRNIHLKYTDTYSQVFKLNS